MTTNGGVNMALTSQAYLDGSSVKQTKSLITELCRLFYTLGWVGGTGGSITAKVHDDSVPKSHQLIIMSPSGVQKERMVEEDMYVLSSTGDILFSPSPKPYPHKPPKCSDCASLFMKAYNMRNAGAVIHSHGMESCVVTMLDPLAKEFRITHMEMIKGIQGHGYYDELVVPIIENAAHERELTESLALAAGNYNSFENKHLKRTQKQLLYWSEIMVSMYGEIPGLVPKLRLNATTISLKLQSNFTNWALIGQLQRCIVLDIEGTTTPISFVTEVLFPYARENVQRHLEATYDTDATQDVIKLLRSQVQDDLQNGVADAVPIPSDEAGKEKVIAALVANVEGMIKSDRKITSLKQLQGHIWQTGFEKNELKGVVFDDVPSALEKWHASGIKVYIYSSGSRLAQRLLFGYTNYGDLRNYLCGFFDTTVGNKKETKSYVEISESLGVHKPSEVLFVTDIYQEAVAAKAAGLEVMISVRPGNGPLPENHGFKTIKSFSEI
ncbi:probable bifunctional methylthioribulose-1-phosphate dehydratase/enolase-phosphatase E1 [Tanacetum coccineum]|uniref:Enolase-phosphatase E1 n=1 Tax=Tanacetum coccineum TaxID=301880 RepID=A0ABQ5BFV8_9ASTR